MIASLAPCFAGTLGPYAGMLALPGAHAGPVAGRDLREAGTVEVLLARFAANYPGGDRRALISMWTQWHFAVAVIPTVAAILVLDRDLPVDLDETALALDAAGRPAAMVLPGEGRPFGADATARFARLLDGHVAPLIDTLVRHFGVSRRLLWTNAGAIFEWALQQAAERALPAPLGEGRASRSDAAGRPNPLFDAVRYPCTGGAQVRQRKVCCLRYLLPGVADCGDLCPLPDVGGAIARKARQVAWRREAELFRRARRVR